MRRFAEWDERTFDLCVDRFTVGLDRSDQGILDRRADRADVEEFELVVAAVHLGLLSDVEAPPPALLERIDRDGRQRVRVDDAALDRAAGRVSTFRSRAIAVAGWLVAAALVFVLLLVDAGEDDVSARREALVADARDLVRASWTATGDPTAVAAGGDVVWSAARQEGYMRFRGLAPNDRAEHQYQLWIFDPTRADWEAKPVDGGVFDVPDSGEVVVPIDAKLTVAETALFAVTLEVPGGVVVSERERLVLTASP